MSDSVLVLLISGGLAVLAILYMVIGYSARYSARFIVRGLGVVMLVVGLWMTGWMQLIINGVRSIIDWFQRTVGTNFLYLGLGIAVLGLLMILFGGLIKVPTRSEARMAKSDRELAAHERARKQAAKQSPKPLGSTTSSTSASSTSTTKQDDELNSIMKKHGI